MHVARSSCGNRHCPVCQHEKAVKWVYRQQLRLLPCNYFLVTFTLPDELRSLARSNPSVVYKAMTLDVFEFIHRFLQHVLPRGFMKIRHYGMLSPNFSVPLEKIRQMICSLHEAPRKRLRELKPPQMPKPLRCPKCCSIMKWWTFLPPLRWGPVG